MTERVLMSDRLQTWGVCVGSIVATAVLVYNAVVPTEHMKRMDLLKFSIEIMKVDIEILEKFGNDTGLVEQLRELYGIKAFFQKLG